MTNPTHECINVIGNIILYVSQSFNFIDEYLANTKDLQINNQSIISTSSNGSILVPGEKSYMADSRFNVSFFINFLNSLKRKPQSQLVTQNLKGIKDFPSH